MDEDISFEVLDYLQTELELQLRNHIAPQFWKWFKSNNPNYQSQGGEKFKHPGLTDGHHFERSDDTFINAVKELHASVAKLLTYVQRMDQLAAHFHKVNINIRLPS